MTDRFIYYSDATLAMRGRASDYARQQGRTCVDTEHLLLAALDRHDYTLSCVFGGVRLTFERAEQAIYDLIGRTANYKRTNRATSLDYTSRAQAAFKAAHSERVATRRRLIEPAHVLLALIADPPGDDDGPQMQFQYSSIAIHVLTLCGVDLALLRQTVLEALAHTGASGYADGMYVSTD